MHFIRIDRKNTFSTKGVFILGKRSWYNSIKGCAVEIYVEYAFIENFLYDFTLLWLAFKAARVQVKRRVLTLSACVGAAFAVLFPILRLPPIPAVVIKLAVGGLLCILPCARLSTRKAWGKYLLASILFFAFSFGFGGTLLAVYGTLATGKKVPSGLVFLGFALLTAVGGWLVKRLYARRAIFSNVYTCTLSVGEGYIQADGFYDSGNLAMKNGLPVCFISPALLYELLDGDLFKAKGQVCDEMQISTLTGMKTVALYAGKIGLEIGGQRVDKDVYFAPSAHMIGREYAVLFNARLWEREKDYAVD